MSTVRRWLLASSSLTLVLVIALVITRHLPREPLAARISTSTAVFDRNGELLRLTLARDDQYRLWTPLEAVSPELVQALLLYEDRKFYRHPGVDPLALVRAIKATLSGGTRQGGSTITMQLARELDGLNTRSVHGKLGQIWRALLLEATYSKHDLLEAHLNLLPYGNNLQGVGAASRVYFGKAARDLSLPEALSLVLIPQSPARRAPQSAEPRALTQARVRLFRDWQAAHPETTDTAQSMQVQLQFFRRSALPFSAPHFVNHVLELQRGTREAQVQTLLDASQQRLVERVLEQYVRDRADVGIRNATAMLVDVRDLSVRAMVGSTRFADAGIDGQVNGALAKRSPGSALKPFIYALAIDQGLIHPRSVLKDLPAAFGPFNPENFDGRFVGPIDATQALIRSRNIPAVTLASRLANPSLYQFLRGAGISGLRGERFYGLALSLGGGEVTMEELVSLYAMLANGGQLGPLRYLRNDASPAPTRMLSEQSSFIVLDMLSQATRPDDIPAGGATSLRPAWKTGTSWGFRDAWTVGVLGPYALAVWVGNFDGSSNVAFVGVQAAAPLFFRLADALSAREPQLVNTYLRPPTGVTQVEVCAASGDLPNAECPRTATTWFVPGVSPIDVSTLHRRVHIDRRTGALACPPYDQANVRTEVVEFWPSDLARSFAQAGMPRRQLASSDCAGATPGDLRDEAPPRITSPRISVVYNLRRHDGASDSIPLSASLGADSRRAYWFVDSAYVGSSTGDTPITWSPTRSGRYTVRAVDDRGRTDERELRVDYVR